MELGLEHAVKWEEFDMTASMTTTTMTMVMMKVKMLLLLLLLDFHGVGEGNPKMGFMGSRTAVFGFSFLKLTLLCCHLSAHERGTELLQSI